MSDGCLVSLKKLDLSHNQLRSIGEFIIYFRLNVVVIHCNCSEPNLSNLTNLESLDLRANAISNVDDVTALGNVNTFNWTRKYTVVYSLFVSILAAATSKLCSARSRRRRCEPSMPASSLRINHFTDTSHAEYIGWLVGILV
jgi:Leucine-rich repeat (LRR) protein